jgi:hypothetical protein
MGGVASSKHEWSWIRGEGRPQVVHQFGDPDPTGEAFSKIRQFNIHASIPNGKPCPSEINILIPYQ